MKGPGTHLTAALEALKRRGGMATGAQIADYVEEKKLLKTEMDTRQAISWVLCLRGSPGLAQSEREQVVLRPVVGPSFSSFPASAFC